METRPRRHIRWWCAIACRRSARRARRTCSSSRPGGSAAAGGLTLRLRCPECDVRTIRDFDAGEAARVDDALSQARLEMIAFYEAVVRNNMALEADLLATALALDLIGADDFEPHRR